MEQNRIFERLAAFEGWLRENGCAVGTREKYLRPVVCGMGRRTPSDPGACSRVA